MLFQLSSSLILVREIARLSSLVVVVWLSVLRRMKNLLKIFRVLFLLMNILRVEVRINRILRSVSNTPLSLTLLLIANMLTIYYLFEFRCGTYTALHRDLLFE